jgi:hypothetical protein
VKTGLYSILAKAAICALIATATLTAKAQFGGLPSKAEVVAGSISIIAVAGAIGVGTYYVIRHDRSIDGCAASGSGGLDLRNRGDGQTYTLTGELEGIKPGERVRVSGKRQKKVFGAQRQFLVEKLAKDYGPCAAP